MQGLFQDTTQLGLVIFLINYTLKLLLFQSFVLISDFVYLYFFKYDVFQEKLNKNAKFGQKIINFILTNKAFKLLFL